MQVLTNILPVVDCPEINSPAQSFASVMNPISLPPPVPATAPFATSLFGPGLVPAPLSWFRQQRKANARHIKMMKRPAKNVNTLDRRKHHHFRSFIHSSWGSRGTVPLVSGPPPVSSASILFRDPTWSGGRKTTQPVLTPAFFFIGIWAVLQDVFCNSSILSARQGFCDIRPSCQAGFAISSQTRDLWWN